MPGRRVAIFVIVFHAIWLNIVVPGHLRGIVQMSKAGHGLDSAPACPLCCCDQAANSGDAQTPAKPGKPMTPEQQKNCAICFFSAHISLPPVIRFDHQSLGLLQRLKPHQCDDLFARIVLMPFDSCGPPAIA